MKVVVCGSYGDIEGFLEVWKHFQRRFGSRNVFPDREHLKESEPCIMTHHRSGNETEATIAVRAKLMKSYFNHIDGADLVVIRNEKNGEEYYGTGTTVELGYALAKDKKIRFTKRPTDSNILSLLNSNSQLDYMDRLS